jgi:WD40 repeat protein
LPAAGPTSTAVTFSPDGRYLASGAADNKIRIWRLSDLALVATLAGHTDVVNALAFSPDGSRLASGGVDNTVRLWDLHRQTAVLSGHTDAVDAVAFSPDGSSLASAGTDNTVRLWNLHDGGTPTVLTGHSDTVNVVAFAGSTLLTAGDDTVRSWDTDVTRTIAHICAIAWPRLSVEDWQRYLPGVDYQPPCP